MPPRCHGFIDPLKDPPKWVMSQVRMLGSPAGRAGQVEPGAGLITSLCFLTLLSVQRSVERDSIKGNPSIIQLKPCHRVRIDFCLHTWSIWSSLRTFPTMLFTHWKSKCPSQRSAVLISLEMTALTLTCGYDPYMLSLELCMMTSWI